MWCSPNVHLAAYSRPHPSHTFINVRVQTTGTVPAAEALRTASTNVGKVCDHVSTTFEQAMKDFEAKESKAGPVAGGTVLGAEREAEDATEDTSGDDSSSDEGMDAD